MGEGKAEAVEKGGQAGGYEVPVLRADRGLGESCVRGSGGSQVTEN